ADSPKTVGRAALAPAVRATPPPPAQGRRLADPTDAGTKRFAPCPILCTLSELLRSRLLPGGGGFRGRAGCAPGRPNHGVIGLASKCLRTGRCSRAFPHRCSPWRRREA